MPTNNHEGRRLSWDACYNIRDLGGYATSDGGQTRWGAVVRADNLYNLTSEGQAALVAYGVSTIIDLRSSAELQREPNPFGQNIQTGIPRYLHMPLEEATDVVVDQSMEDGASIQEIYCLMVDAYAQRIAAVFKSIAQASDDGGVLVHCAGGKDRTGVVVGLLLALVGVPDSTIAEDYAQSYTCNQPVYEQGLAHIEDPAKRERLAQLLQSPPEAMLGMLSYVRAKYGGVAEYLSESGLSRDDMEKIRRRLVG